MAKKKLPLQVACSTCHRQYKPRPNNTLPRHKDGLRWCPGSYQPPAAPDDNATPGGSGFAWLPTPEPILIEVPRVGAKAQPLADWWAARALAEIEMVVAKAVEYGATDLRDLGYQMLDMAGRREQFMDPEDLHYSDAYATEVGIVFYAQGKLARAVAAIKEGRRPSVDTWLDLGVYARMAQRVHDRGGWPGV
jgi:hypothetical protein